jgi:transmembrane sensor
LTGSGAIDEGLLEQASGWHRTLAGDDADWNGFVVWLEADPRHRQAFDTVALTERLIDDHRQRLLAILPDDRMRPPTAISRAMAIAAVLAAALLLPIPLRSAGDVTYAAGIHARRVSFDTGITIDLAPASVLVASRRMGRLRLARGEAYFTIRPDAARTVSVRAGRYAIADTGTRFAINLSGGSVRVGVAEGRLSITQRHSDAVIGLRAGQQMLAPPLAGTAAVSAVSRGDIGSWRQGRLAYADAPLALVAADVSRHVGRTIWVDPRIAARRFSGRLTIGDGARPAAMLGRVMKVSCSPDGDRIRLAPAIAS